MLQGHATPVCRSITVAPRAGAWCDDDWWGELARLYGTLFITDVPQFTPADEDAARRFIMLIDEFYDRCVNIVVSAAAPPTELYQGQKLQFEFQRAASRLIEMQTQQYLAGQHRQQGASTPGIIRAQL